jgi:hypothetical protein
MNMPKRPVEGGSEEPSREGMKMVAMKSTDKDKLE